MDQDTSSLLGKSTAIVLVVSTAAIALDFVFAHLLHLEPLGLLGFGLFCLGYGMVLGHASTSTRRKGRSPSYSSVTCSPSKKSSCAIARPRTNRILQGASRVRPIHALTIDLEDYFHTDVASQGVSFAEWEQQPSRIEASTHRLLDLLDRNQTRTTFFVLGWVALRYPALITEIHDRGHEIGCHSLNHRLISRMYPLDFYENTRTAKNIIESIIQEEILGYRAPCFSLTPGCEWAYETLAKLGFRYDSSVHPVDHPTYGNPMAPRTPYFVAGGRILELPIATWRLAGRNRSIGGGAYLRLLPYQYIYRGLRAWEKEMNSPATLYLHPWEIDSYQPVLHLSLVSTIRQTWGTRTMEYKLQRLLRDYRFASVREVYQDLLAPRIPARREPPIKQSEDVAQVAG